MYKNSYYILIFNLLLLSNFSNQVLPFENNLFAQKAPIPICSPDSIGILLQNPASLLNVPVIVYANGYMNENSKCMQPFPPGYF
jgi:hypothetical protein